MEREQEGNAIGVDLGVSFIIQEIFTAGARMRLSG